MAAYTRNNAWNSGGTLSNSDLLWYAKGVGQMMTRPIADPTSWWFYAAIHGEYANPQTAWYPKPAAFPAWGFVQAPPTIPTTPLPTAQAQAQYWNQCQHGSWYFFPWHRGYLLSIEAQLRKDIVALGGPTTWALPYWSYFGGNAGSQYQMPPAFAQKTLPDGTANALYFTMRYGPDSDSNIFIPTAASPDKDPAYGVVTEEAMHNTVYTGHNKQTLPPGFGGPNTAFSHSGQGHGNFERNPHDLVHVYVGGQLSDTEYGLMADPNTAALDPVFYLHHCNIDRLWAVWNASGNANPTDPAWLNGPAKQFAMPGAAGQPWYYTPGQMQDLAPLGYDYQEMTALPAAPALLTERLKVLGATPDAVARQAARPQASGPTELLGASANGLRIQGRGTSAAVKLDATVRRKTVESFAPVAKMATAPPPDKAFLKLENITGTFDATVLNVYLDAPPAAAPTSTAAPAAAQSVLAGSVALFGLRLASLSDGQHGGEGLTFTLDITPLIDQLHLAQGLDVASLQVSIVPNKPLSAKGEVQVGRISVFRQASEA
ncbi:hypothetical protein GCM10022409_20570 [Hymenobacter glaciei]|uniref:Tyrosinase copper-binding domain-containing protein n=1 Tax=Hymenobacter glaciei TaxID=877209 RepID=A0ABP7U4J0_9BACT